MKLNKPKILAFTDWYLPGHRAGGPITSMANLVNRVGAFVDFRIVCSDRDYMSDSPYSDILPNRWTKMGHAEVCYLPPGELSKSGIRNILSLHPKHTVYINGVFSKYFSVTPLIEANKLRRRIIIAPRGMFAPGALSIKAKKKRVFLNLAKFMGWYRQVDFHATHNGEADQIKEVVSRRARIHVIPNLPNLPNLDTKRVNKTQNEINIFSVARIAKEKNTAFALEVLKQIPSSHKVRFHLVGPVYDTRYFEKCKEVAGSLPANVSVEFKGAMTPIQIEKEWANYHLFFLPTLGENYGHAIIEAMLNGLPVLISDKTPWKNLEDDHLGREASLNDPSKFVEYITKIAEMDESQYQSAFENVPNRAAERLHIEENVASYIKLFE